MTAPDGPRPTHPDGTPYRYSEIEDGGWEVCDACELWSQHWTRETPHVCLAPVHVGRV